MMKKLSLLIAVLWTAMMSFATTYVPFTGTLTEGDYLITYGAYAMSNTVASGRLGYADFTQSEAVTDPDAAIVWHIAFVEGSDNVVTLYNAAEKKYAAGTGVKNKGALVADVTDYAKWEVTSSNSGFEFVNVGNKAKEVNYTLRNNGTYGYACYSTNTGGALKLYAVDEGYVAPTTRTITLDANIWNTDDAPLFAAWTWEGDGEGQWSDFFTNVEGTTYKGEIPVEHSGIIFVRVNPEAATKGMEWSYVYNQTDNLTVNSSDPYFTITAWHQEGQNDGNSLGEWGTPIVYNTCAEVNAVTANTEMTLGEVTVVFVKGSYVYVQDETGATLVYTSSYGNLKAGDRVKGIAGTAKLYNGLPELAASTAFDKLEITAGEAPVVPDATAAITAADVNKVFMFRGMQMPQGAEFTSNSATNIEVTFYGSKIQLRNNWKDAAVFDDDKEYTMLGCVAIYNEDIQVYVTNITADLAEGLYIAGDMTGWQASPIQMSASPTADNVWEAALNLNALKTYEFKVISVDNNGNITWYGNAEAATMTADNCTGWWLNGEANVGLQTVAAGDYTFVFNNNENREISVVYPDGEQQETNISVAEALKLITTLENNVKSDVEYTVTGIVRKMVSAYDEKNNVVTVDIADDEEGELLRVYKAVPFNEADKEIAVGDKIEVVGYLYNYYSSSNGNISEINEGGRYVIIEKAPAPQKEAGIYLAGTMTSWADNLIKLEAGSEENTYTAVVALGANADEQFKILVVTEDGAEAWYGLQGEGTMNETSKGWWLYTNKEDGSDAANVGLHTADKGDYTFIYIANDNHEVSVIYPEKVEPVTVDDAIYYETFGKDVTVNTAWAEATFTDSQTADISESTWKVSKSTTSPCDIAGSSAESHMFSGSENTACILRFGDLSNYKNLKFACNWQNNASSKNNTPRTFAIMFSADGGDTWSDNLIDVDKITDQAWYTFSYDVTEEYAANFAVKFVNTAKNTSRVDDIMLYEAEQGGDTPQPEMYTFYIETSKIMGEGANNFAAWTWQEGGLNAAFSNFFMRLDVATMEAIGKQMGAPEGTDFSKYTVYAASVPAGMDSVIIVRFDEAVDVPVWNASAAQTFDLNMEYRDIPFLVITEYDENVQKFKAVWGVPEDQETKFYIKSQMSENENNWVWTEMEKNEDGVYTLELMYFGGIGVNFSAEKQEGDESLVTFKEMGLTAMPEVGDIIRYTVDVTGALMAENLGKEVVCENQYGIMLNGEFKQAERNPEKDNEFMIIGIELAENDKFTLYDNCVEAAWTVAIDEASVEGVVLVEGDESSYVVRTAGAYDLYIQLIPENDKLYIGKHEVVEPTFFIKTQMSVIETDWDWNEMKKNDDGVYTLELKYFGGTGVNFSAEKQEGDETLVTFKEMGLTAMPEAGDIIRYTVDVTGALKAENLGHEEVCENQYGIMLNGEFVKAEFNKVLVNDQQEEYGKEYKIIGIELAENDKFTLYDNCAGAAWTVAIDEASAEGIALVEGDESSYVVRTAGVYDLYIKLIPDNDQFYIGLYQEPETHYFIKAQMSENENDWSWNEMQKNDDGVYTLELMYFGGIGVNFSTEKQEGDETLVTFKEMGLTAMPEAGDKIRYTVEEGSLVAENLGHVEVPQPEMHTFYFNATTMMGEGANNFAAWTWNGAEVGTWSNFFMRLDNETLEAVAQQFNAVGINVADYAIYAAIVPADVENIIIARFDKAVDFADWNDDVAAKTFDLKMNYEEIILTATDAVDGIFNAVWGTPEIPQPVWAIQRQQSENENDWGWIDLRKDEETGFYTVEFEYFGNTGVDFGTREQHQFVTFEALGLTEAPVAGDIIRIIYDGDKSLRAINLGHETPCVGEYGIMLNGEFKQAASNPEKDNEYMIIGIELAENDKFTLYDNCAEAAWTVAIDETSAEGIVLVEGDESSYVVRTAGTYDLYIKLIKDNDQLYIGLHQEPVINYYIKAQMSEIETDWGWNEMQKDNDGNYILDLTYFGGDGVNFTADLSAENPEYITFETLNITPEKYDIIRYTYSGETLTAAIVGHEEPCEGQYGIMFNGDFMQAAINEAAENEYMLIGVEFTENDKFTLYDNCDKGGAFTVPLEEASVAGIVLENDEYVVNAAGTYDLYIKLIPHDNKLYIGLHQEPETHYYIKSQVSENANDWSWTEIVKGDDDKYAIDLNYFGGIGVNFSTEQKEGDETLITFEALGIAPVAGDVIRYSVYEGALSAQIVNHVEPCTPTYGIMRNGEFTQAVINTEAPAIEYMVLGVEFAAGDEFAVYNGCTEEVFTLTLENEGNITMGDNQYTVNNAGTYDLYLKLANGTMYVNKHEVAETHYYIKVQQSENGDDWAWTEIVKGDDDKYAIDLNYFGGIGVNFSTEQKEGDETLITFEALGIAPVAGDVVRYSVYEGALSAQVVNHVEPCVNEFGIMLDGEFMLGEINPANNKEYMILGVKLAKDTEFTLWNNCRSEGWVIDPKDGSNDGIVVEDNKYVVKKSGVYDLYLEISAEGDQLYISRQSNSDCQEYVMMLNGVKQLINFAQIEVTGDVVSVKAFQFNYEFNLNDVFSIYSECSDEINDALKNIDLAKIAEGIEKDEDGNYRITKGGAYSFILKMNEDTETVEASAEEDKTPTAVDNVNVEMMNGKYVRDGQLFIIRDGVIYNAQGAVISK